MKILLFDMDGVLLESGGYHHAFQETVNLVGRLLGYQRVKLTPQDIAAFEAAGVFSEWDSSAMCAALLLENLWAEHPALTLPPTPTPPVLPEHKLRGPLCQPPAPPQIPNSRDTRSHHNWLPAK